MVKESAKKPAKQRQVAERTAPAEEKSLKSSILQDARFQHLVTDPRFKQLPQTQRKVKIDKRFQGMFTDDKFNVKYQVDKYGRRINKSNAEDLRKYYELDSDSNDEDEQAEQLKEEQAITHDTDAAAEVAKVQAASDENDELASDGEEVPKSLKARLLDPNIDYARGEGRLMTDSSSDDESSEDEDPEMYIDHVWGELDNDAETTDESTNRLAVCNMDWDRIRAQDLMVLFNSFLPPGGSILSVTIYPSQYGKERMAEEDVNGPIELQGLGKVDKQAAHSDDDEEHASSSDEELVKEQDSDVEEGDDYHMEKLRQYQLNRLRYYYAVVVCDSVATADKIYKECDGIEYESSATRVDLRFIPDDTSFDEDEPTDTCTELPDTNSYQPRQFTTTALQQAKVDLTWDETAVERRELGDKLASGKLEAIDDKELRKIVAYSSAEEEADDEVAAETATAAIQEAPSNVATQASAAKAANNIKKNKVDTISKYKALLAEITEKEESERKQKYEMEYTWNIEDTKETNDEKDQEQDAAQKQLLTPIEKVLQKRSEKNKKRKEERKKKKLLAKGIDPDNYNSDDDSDSIPEGIDLNDPYFAEEFENGNLVKPKPKAKTKKQQHKQATLEDDDEAAKQAKELALLLDDDDEDEGKQHFSLEKIQKAEQETKSKKKRRKQLKKSKTTVADARKELEDNFQINLNDERFQAIYKSANYNIDPTDSHYKKTKAMEQIIHEKLKRRHGDEQQAHNNGSANAEEQTAKRPKKQLENTLLIKSLKRKIQMKQQSK